MSDTEETISKERLQNEISNFIKDKKYNEKAERTIKHYNRVLNDFSKWLPDIEEVTKQVIIDYKFHLKDIGLKTVTVNNKVVIINAYLHHLDRDKMRIDLIKVQQRHKLTEVLSDIDYKRLLRAAKRAHMDDMAMMMQTLCETGARIAEIKFITVEAIKKSNYINVSNKSKERNLILTNELRRDLKKYCKSKGIKQGHIFVSKKNSECPASEATIWRDMQKIAGMAKVSKKKVHAHSFRHLFSLRWIANGGTEGQLADMLGHSSTATTRIYIRTTDEELKKQLENMKKRR